MQTNEVASILNLTNFDDYLSEVHLLIDARLSKDNPELSMPALKLLRHGGKRLRPLLVLAGTAISGASPTKASIKAGAAVELLHLSSLIHDDIIDDADKRHGMASINASEGTKSALLIGDYLLARSLQLANEADAKIGELLSETFALMCLGQSTELRMRNDYSRSIDEYLQSINQKSSALLAASCKAGGICLRLPESQLQALYTYGQAFGMLFQIIDDLQDLYSNATNLGKTANNDVREGIYTLPLLYALKTPKSSQIRALLKTRKLTENDYQKLLDLISASGSVKKTFEKINEYAAIAKQSLDIFAKNPVTTGLKSLPRMYTEALLNKTNASDPRFVT